MKNNNFDELRKRMVEEQIVFRDVKNPLVIDAMLKVPRHLFVPEIYINESYNDYPLEIGYGQTISQPYIVALMTELVDPKPKHKILEIGTGSGYQAAILAHIVKEVYTVERIPELVEYSKNNFKKLNINNIKIKQGNGYLGWEEEAPFDGIIVTACAKDIPKKLIEQLKINSHLIIPIGSFFQELFKITRIDESNYSIKSIIPVRFVPLIDSENNY